MKNTMLTLLKFKCDNKDCQFECFVNQNNNVLTHYNVSMAALLDWTCPDCNKGQLRYAATNTKFEFSLVKKDKTAEQEKASR